MNQQVLRGRGGCAVVRHGALRIQTGASGPVVSSPPYALIRPSCCQTEVRWDMLAYHEEDYSQDLRRPRRKAPPRSRAPGSDCVRADSPGYREALGRGWQAPT